MPIRKRRQPAPSFRRPAPYSGVTGQHAGIGPAKVDLTRLAMFQVCVTDTHDNYVGCCGLDPEANVYFDSDHPMAVAKPYDVRGTFPYTVGQMIVCAKVRTAFGGTAEYGSPSIVALGDNPGVASSSTGQPADLDEEIDMLKTDDGLPIFWLHVGGGSSLTPRILYDDVAPGDTDKLVWPVDDTMTADESTDPPTIQVQNTFPGMFRGFGSSHSGFSASTAAKVWTSQGSDGKEYIVACSGSTIAKGTLSGSLSQGSSASASLTIDGVSVTVTVYDYLMKSGATAIVSGKKIVAQYFPSENKWYVTEAECA